MPPIQFQIADTEIADTEIADTEIADVETLGPAARQRAFVQERLRGGATDDPGARRTAATVQAAETVSREAPPAAETRNAAELRQHRLQEFRTRQLTQARTVAPAQTPVGPLATAQRSVEITDFLATNRWCLLGPTVVREGQSGQQPAMSGRVRAIAVTPGSQRIYVAAANGGVWRSEEGGHNWLSLMDAFDLNPTRYRADSLACGAMAVAPGRWAGEDFIVVGSGEPGVEPWFQGDSAYFGVGPIVSTDGGLHWITEPSTPSLAGRAFYALAIDPLWPQRVVAATIDGLYVRQPTAAGGYHWTRQQSGYFCSVVVAQRNGVTTFYAAAWYGGIWQSTDGVTWRALGRGFPGPGTSGGSTTDEGVNVNVGRVGLAVQPDNPNVLYALVANSAGHLHGVYRLDRAAAVDADPSHEVWQPVRNIPPTLFGPMLQRPGQGGYDLAIAVDPDDVNRLYIGGSTVLSDGIVPVTVDGDWSGALYRCEIEVHPTKNTVQAEPTYIGGAIHSDLHALVFAPGNAQELWVGCDGGLFVSHTPRANPHAPQHSAGLFQPRNTGLSTLTMNHLAHHPTEPAVLFCGTQDNGGLRYTGDPVWLYSSGGDSGYFVINWRDPYRVLTTYTYNMIFRSNDGGQRYSYEAVHVLPAEGDVVDFYAPLAGVPADPTQPATADRVAFGSERVWLSERFGGEGLQWNGTTWIGEVDWRSLPSNQAATDRLAGPIAALVFASATCLYAGTQQGVVYRFTQLAAANVGGIDGEWQRTQLPAIGNAEEQARPGPVTAIAIDPTVADGMAIYVTLGGITNPQRLWHFDGTAWTPRSGPTGQAQPSPLALLDVQHNALVVDPQQPSHLYVAADIGVWRSVDGGQSWAVFARGLPDAAVVDLKLHTPSRLLRAATHGRGVYEFDLGRPQRSVELYVRDHVLDLGRQPAVNGQPDPTTPGGLVMVGQSPDIKVDPLTADGSYSYTEDAAAAAAIDLYTFTVGLPLTATVPTHSRSNLQTHVYVQVHNRGLLTANNVQVMLLLATVEPVATESIDAPPLPILPDDYAQFVRAGLPIATPQWQTLGITTIHGLRSGHPRIAHFTLDADQLPTPGRLRATTRFALVTLVHAVDDPFIAEATASLTPGNNRHAAHRWITVAPFAGKVPAGTPRRRPQRTPDDWLAEHQVQRGETLSQLAKHYYNLPRLWPVIYYANQSLIGANPSYLQIGWVLKIPYQPDDRR